jgi:hypothetical protein
MPSCYLLAVARGSVLSVDTNAFTLFELVEQFQLSASNAAPDALVQLPFELHAYWSFGPDEIDVDYEIRLLARSDSAETFDVPVTHLKSSTQRLRMRSVGIGLRMHSCRSLVVEWRKQGETAWNREPIEWPFLVDVIPAGSPAAPPVS